MRIHPLGSLKNARLVAIRSRGRPLTTSEDFFFTIGVPKESNHPSSSGSYKKLETFLRYSKISYELCDIYPFKAPRGKVPYVEITHDGQTATIPDSRFIIQYLVERGLIKDPDELESLTMVQRAESRAFEAYVEEVLYLAISYDRWWVDENHAVATQEAFGNTPWPLRSSMSWFIRWRISGALYSAGMGHHLPEEMHRLQKEAFEALEVKYAGPKYLHGGELPSRIDPTVYGFLAKILSLDGNPYFSSLV